MSLSILSIAILGKQGQPLFLESYGARRGGQADLKWHYAAHTALDYFEERGASLSFPNPSFRADFPSFPTRTAGSEDDRVILGSAVRNGGLCGVRRPLCRSPSPQSPFLILFLPQLRLPKQHPCQICPLPLPRRRRHPRHRRQDRASHPPLPSYFLIVFSRRFSAPSTTPTSPTSPTPSPLPNPKTPPHSPHPYEARSSTKRWTISLVRAPPLPRTTDTARCRISPRRTIQYFRTPIRLL
jgi:hypothetical protein